MPLERQTIFLWRGIQEVIFGNLWRSRHKTKQSALFTKSISPQEELSTQQGTRQSRLLWRHLCTSYSFQPQFNTIYARFYENTLHNISPTRINGEDRRIMNPTKINRTTIEAKRATKIPQNARERITIFSLKVVGTGCPLIVSQFIFIYQHC